MRRAERFWAAMLLVAVAFVCLAAIGGMVMSMGSVSHPSIHSEALTPVSITPQESAYLEHLKVRGVAGDYFPLVEEGLRVCEDFGDADITYPAERDRVGRRIKPQYAAILIDAALIHLCPEGGM